MLFAELQGSGFRELLHRTSSHAVMIVGWKLLKRTKWVKAEEMDLVTDRFDQGMTTEEREDALKSAKMGQWSAEGQGWKGKAKCIAQWLFA